LDDADLIAGYVQHATALQRGVKDGNQFSWDLDSLVSNDPDRAWRLICEIIRQITDDAALAYAAAGPLEDLLKRHPAFIDRVEDLARRDARFRHALSGVWVDGEVGERLNTLLGDEPRL